MKASKQGTGKCWLVRNQLVTCAALPVPGDLPRASQVTFRARPSAMNEAVHGCWTVDPADLRLAPPPASANDCPAVLSQGRVPNRSSLICEQRKDARARREEGHGSFLRGWSATAPCWRVDATAPPHKMKASLNLNYERYFQNSLWNTPLLKVVVVRPDSGTLWNPSRLYLWAISPHLHPL